jgi:hypothetical protein
LSGALLVAVGGDTLALIPLYAIGVFTGFTLSQSGLVAHWRRTRPPSWRYRASLNGLGAATTGLATVEFLLTKFTEGAWVVVLAVSAFIAVFVGIHHYYDGTRRALAGVIGADVGPRAVRAPGVAPVITVTPDAARDRDVRGGPGVDAPRVDDPGVHVGLCLVPRIPARSQLPAGCTARGMGVVDMTAHLTVPAGHRHAFASPHGDFGDVRGREDQSADEHR